MTEPDGPYGHPSVDGRLRAHLQRVGADHAAATDPHAHFQVELLRHFLIVAESAMRAEDIDPGTARRVIDKLIYGLTPNPAQVELHRRLQQRLTDIVHHQSLRHPSRLRIDT